MGEMKPAAAGADYSRVAELERQLKDLLAQWAQTRGKNALTAHERTCLNEMQSDMQTLTVQCEKARDLSMDESKALAANRDAAEWYLQNSRLKD